MHAVRSPLVRAVVLMLHHVRRQDLKSCCWHAPCSLLQVVNSGDQAGAFHLARQFEAAGRIPEAVRYYTLVSGRRGTRLQWAWA